MYGNEGDLINQIAAMSLTKAFGKSKIDKLTTKPAKDLCNHTDRLENPSDSGGISTYF